MPVIKRTTSTTPKVTATKKAVTTKEIKKDGCKKTTVKLNKQANINSQKARHYSACFDGDVALVDINGRKIDRGRPFTGFIDYEDEVVVFESVPLCDSYKMEEYVLGVQELRDLVSACITADAEFFKDKPKFKVLVFIYDDEDKCVGNFRCGTTESIIDEKKYEIVSAKGDTVEVDEITDES